MKHLNQFITEYIVKKKLDKFIDSEEHYKYFPKTKDELIENIEELISKDIYDLNIIDVSKITDMSDLFKNLNFKKLKYLKSQLDVSKWNVSNVKDMKYMFRNCSKFDSDLSNWDISNVTNMKYMFQNCENFKAKDLDKWNISNVKNMEYMFDNCMKLKKIPSWY